MEDFQFLVFSLSAVRDIWNDGMSLPFATLHWLIKILAHGEKCLFLMYFWTLNSNMFPEFLYHPHLSHQVKGL